MKKVTPCLWFANQAEEAMNFYVSLFEGARVLDVNPGPDGSLMTAFFELDGRRFMVLNGNPQYEFTPASSLMVSCESQEEVDELWEKLTADGGEEQPCGWLKDKFGVSWQVVPKVLGELMTSDKSGRVAQEFFQMKKIDIARLQQACEAE